MTSGLVDAIKLASVTDGCIWIPAEDMRWHHAGREQWLIVGMHSAGHCMDVQWVHETHNGRGNNPHAHEGQLGQDPFFTLVC